MKNNTKFFKPLLLLALVTIFTMEYSTSVEAIGKKISYTEYKAENKSNPIKNVNSINISADGQSLVVDKPILEFRSNYSDLDTKYRNWDDTVGYSKDSTVNLFLEFEIYNLKNDQLVATRSFYDMKGMQSHIGGQDEDSLYCLAYATNSEGKEVGEILKYDEGGKLKTPIYIRLRVTATDTVTGLTGTSEWSDNIYYVPEASAGGIRTLSRNKIKVTSAKLKCKGVKVKDYIFYVEVMPRGKGKNTYYKFTMKNKKYSKTITKLGKHKINTVKNRYTLTAVPRIKHKGKTKMAEAYVLSSDYTWIPY